MVLHLPITSALALILLPDGVDRDTHSTWTARSSFMTRAIFGPVSLMLLVFDAKLCTTIWTRWVFLRQTAFHDDFG
jgi:hypothetical protein